MTDGQLNAAASDVLLSRVADLWVVLNKGCRAVQVCDLFSAIRILLQPVIDSYDGWGKSAQQWKLSVSQTFPKSTVQLSPISDPGVVPLSETVTQASSFASMLQSCIK